MLVVIKEDGLKSELSHASEVDAVTDLQAVCQIQRTNRRCAADNDGAMAIGD